MTVTHPGTIIVGRLASGIGLGRHFTRLDWARRQFIEKLGIDPFPGTVNLRIDEPGSLLAWQRLRSTAGILITNPGTGPTDCNARCFLIEIHGREPAAIVLPEVVGYAPDLVEIIAGRELRKALRIADGDLVEFAFAAPETGGA